MACIYPRWNKVTKSMMSCGKCIACRIRIRLDWEHRMFHESLSTPGNNSFITLTYSEDNVPLDFGLDKRALQLFLKRFRKDVSTPIRYYACGEYGGEGLRPHYHLIIFGWIEDNPAYVGSKDGKPIYSSPVLQRTWPFGFNTWNYCDDFSFGYVAKYISKECPIDFESLCISPPFHIQSQGLGREYLEVNHERLMERGSFRYKGRNTFLPRYYKTKLHDNYGYDTETLFEDGKERARQEYTEDMVTALSRLTYDEFNDIDYEVHHYRKRGLEALEKKLLFEEGKL